MFLQANIENRLAAITIKCWQALWTAPMFGLSSNPNLAQAFQAFLCRVPQLAQLNAACSVAGVYGNSNSRGNGNGNRDVAHAHAH